MRLIPLTGMLLLTGVLNLGCNAAPVGPADPQDISTVTEAPSAVSFRSTSARAAVIIRNNGCALFDGDGEFVQADRDLIVATQSTRLTTTLICKAKRLANSNGRAVRFNSENNPVGSGVGCGVLRPDGLVVTTAWTETVSASGIATLRCQFRL